MSADITPTSKEVDEIAAQIVDAPYSVHRSLGPGLLESAYECCLEHELKKEDFRYNPRKACPSSMIISILISDIGSTF